MVEIKNFWKYLITNKSKRKSVKGRGDGELKKTTLVGSITEGVTESTGKKKLSYGVVLFILINSILGSSLFYLPGLGVKSSGPASLIAWAVLFIVAAVIMVYIGELITLHPTSGGTYEFCKRAYGRFVSFMAGWLIWLAGNLGMALAIVAAAEYFIPTTVANYFLLRIVFSVVWILALNYMAFRGIDAGATMLVVFGALSLVVVGLMVLPSFIDVPGLFSGSLGSRFDWGLLEPFFIHESGGVLLYLALSLFLISEAFFGFEALSYMANEVEDKKKLGKALITAILICGAIMVVYIFSSLGTVSHHDYITDARPFAVQAMNNMGGLGQQIVVFGMYLVIIGAAAAWPIAGSRLVRALAKDGLFLKGFGALHHKHKSPYRAVYFQTIMVGLFSWLVFRGYMKAWGDPYRTMYLIFVLLSLIVLGLVVFAVPVLRRKEAKLPRVFKAPFPWLGASLIVGLFLLLVGVWIFLEGSLAWSIIKLAGSFVVLGLPVYFLVEMYYNPQAIKKMSVLTSYVSFGGGEKKLVKGIDLMGKKVLEYGCATGGLTKHLAKRVTSKGEVYATDFVIEKVKVAERRLKKHKHVKIFHHGSLSHFKARVRIPRIDVLVSSGMLSNLQKPLVVLKHLGAKVRKGGRVIFSDYDKFFHVIPNIHWAESDEKVVKMFRKAGFKVSLRRRRSLLWSKLKVEGRKV